MNRSKASAILAVDFDATNQEIETFLNLQFVGGVTHLDITADELRYQFIEFLDAQ